MRIQLCQWSGVGILGHLHSLCFPVHGVSKMTGKFFSFYF